MDTNDGLITMIKRFTVSLSIDIEAENPIEATMKMQDLISCLKPGWEFEVMDIKTGVKTVIKTDAGNKSVRSDYTYA